jgi:hypothetical protein
MLAGMSGLHGMDAIQPDVHVAANVVWLLLLYAVVWFVPTTRQWMNSGVGGFGWRRSPEWAVAMGCGATLGLLAAGGAGEFLYFRF